MKNRIILTIDDKSYILVEAEDDNCENCALFEQCCDPPICIALVKDDENLYLFKELKNE